MLSTGFFPEILKQGTSCIIPKAGKDNTVPLNYRPITLLELLPRSS